MASFILEEAPIEIIAEYLQYVVDTANKLSEKEPIRGNHEAWKTAYDIVFSDNISCKIADRFPDFKWDNPDRTYMEDVVAYVDAFCVYAKNRNMFMSFEKFSEIKNKEENDNE